jgi:hypothetical protein
MIKVTFVEPDTKEWIDWREKCALAIQSLIADFKAGNKLVVTDLYKKQKDILFDTKSNFYGKCAYCESLITANQPGDIEHFRPKGRITDSNNKPIKVPNEEGILVSHPGYYWLAYELSNLLPACIDCNRPSKGNSSGSLVGKWDQFPVNGNHAIEPGEEVHESPYLINPVTENPEDHLEIDSLGVIHAKDDRGEKCKEIFGLNLRQSLIDERKRTYQSVKNELRLQIIEYVFNTNDHSHVDEIQLYKDGKRPYSLAGRKAISDFANENQHIINFINQ